MGGGDLNAKKSWHPSTLKNLEKTWKAEQKEAEESRKILQMQKEIKEERFKEEMEGAVAKSEDEEKKLNWMYKGPGSHVSREEYLLGRKIDKSFEILQKEETGDKSENQEQAPKSVYTIEHEINPECIVRKEKSNFQVDMKRKLLEDPLFMIRQTEEANKKAIISNPVKMKQLALLVGSLKKDEKKKKKKSKHSKTNKEKKQKKIKKEKHKKTKKKPQYSSPEDTSDSSSPESDFTGAAAAAAEAHGRKRFPDIKSKRRRSEDIHKKQLKKKPASDSSDSDEKFSSRKRSKRKRSLDTKSSRRRSPFRPGKNVFYKNSSGSDEPTEQVTKEQVTKGKSLDSKARRRKSPESRSTERSRREIPDSFRDASAKEFSRSRSHERSGGVRSSIASKNNFDSHKDKPTSRHRGRSRSPFSRNDEERRKRKLSDKEIEQKRQEMMLAAVRRDEERKQNVKRHREETKREEEEEKDSESFIRNLGGRSLGVTVESRIRSKAGTVQKGSAHMNSHFLKR